MDLPDEITIPLRKTISVGTVAYTEIKLSEPTAGQLVKASKAGTAMEQLAVMIQLNGKVPMAMVEQMLQRDLEAAADFLGSFGSNSLTTSPT